MTKLYLMRHGQTLFNQLQKIQGACDSPLTELGIYQANKARQYFDRLGITFNYLYSSTQERASDTLEIIAPQSAYQRLKGLKEWHFGLYEGAPEYLNPPHKDGQDNYGDYFVAYGGESIAQVATRMQETLQMIVENVNNQSESVLVVSHGGAMFSFYKKWRKPEDVRPSFSNCCILVYDYQDGCFNLIESTDPIKEMENE